MALKVLQKDYCDLQYSQENVSKVIKDFLISFLKLSKVQTYRPELINSFDKNISTILNQSIVLYLKSYPVLDTFKLLIRVFDNEEEYNKYFNNLIYCVPGDSIGLNTYEIKDTVTGDKIIFNFIAVFTTPYFIEHIDAKRNWELFLIIKM